MALDALKFDMRPIRDDYARRRDLIYNGLRDHGFTVSKPNGAFYIFPEAPGGDGEKFVLAGIEQSLLTVPGNVFSARNTNFRISFATTETNLRRGLDVLGRLAGQFRG
jgi:aspartate aminotransferase/aminotransferase